MYTILIHYKNYSIPGFSCNYSQDFEINLLIRIPGLHSLIMTTARVVIKISFINHIFFFRQKLHCGSCRFVTDCTFSLNMHLTRCNRIPAIAMPRLKLTSILHCTCGYSSDDGNQVAKHLALCERKTAYPTAESAQSVKDTHSMLDVLGLVRRNDDTQVSKVEQRFIKCIVVFKINHTHQHIVYCS